jgi:hypothetical protein
VTLPLPCGHDPLPHEHLRAGADHWCPTEQRWYGPGMPLAVGRHLAAAHGVSTPPPDDAQAAHLHGTLHRSPVAPLGHAHPCPRCGADHSNHREGSLDAELACTRARAAAARTVALADQMAALERDLRAAAHGRITQALGEDGGLLRCYGCGAWVEGAEVCAACQAAGL